MKYWTLESWGADYPPEDAEDVIAQANEMIDEYAAEHGEEAAEEYAETLWERYCSTGEI